MSYLPVTPEEFLSQNGGSLPGFRFTNVGDKCRGRILTRPYTKVMPAFDKSKPDEMNMIVEMEIVQARGGRTEKDPGGRVLAVHDMAAGERFALYLTPANGQTRAVSEACRNARVPMPEVGGVLDVEFIGYGQQSNPALNPPKQYAASYVAPQGAAPQGNGYQQQPYQQAPVAQYPPRPTYSPEAQQYPQPPAAPQPQQQGPPSYQQPSFDAPF